jgi:hypothetical protein
MSMIPIRYRDFHDVPRAFVVEHAGSTFFFDSPFDEEADEYPDTYRVYTLDPARAMGLGERSWVDLASDGRLIGEIPVDRVRFDATKRAAIDDGVFGMIRIRLSSG